MWQFDDRWHICNPSIERFVMNILARMLNINILLQVRSTEENNLQLDGEEVVKGFFFTNFVGDSNDRVDFKEGYEDELQN